jgi:hypothetical protein
MSKGEFSSRSWDRDWQIQNKARSHEDGLGSSELKAHQPVATFRYPQG